MDKIILKMKILQLLAVDLHCLAAPSDESLNNNKGLLSVPFGEHCGKKNLFIVNPNLPLMNLCSSVKDV